MKNICGVLPTMEPRLIHHHWMVSCYYLYGHVMLGIHLTQYFFALEFIFGQLQAKDLTEAIERHDNVNTRNPTCPLPSMGWMGSHQSATFFSNNSSSSTALGCGALELSHPMGGQMYRAVKNILFNRICESRASVSHYIRVVRAAFTASFLRDSGITQLALNENSESEMNDKEAPTALRPPFVICVEEMLKKQGLTHAIFTRALR